MRLLAISLTFLLVLKGCALLPPQAVPAADPVKSEASAPDSPAEESVKPTYEAGVLAAVWAAQARGFQLELVEPSNGEPVPGFTPIPIGMNYQYSFSPDGQTLAVIGYKSDQSPTRPSLHLIDLSTWKDNPIELEVTGWASKPAFSPDGKYLATAFNDRKSTLMVFNLKQAVVAETVPGFDISQLKYTSDGASLMAYGQLILNRFTSNESTSGPAKATLYNARDLSVRWSADLDGVRDGIYPKDEKAAETTNIHEDPEAALFLYPGLVFAPDHDSLYVLHADEEKLTTVNFETRSMRTVSIQPKLSWFEQFLMLGADVAHAKVANGTFRNAVISPDGKTIYSIGTQNQTTILSNGDWDVKQTPLGFQVIDPADGSALLELDINASDLSIAPDGSMVFAQNWNDMGRTSTQIFNVKTGEFTAPIKNAFLRPIQRMDGSLIFVSSTMNGDNRSYMSAYSTDGKLLGEWTVIVYADWLTPQ